MSATIACSGCLASHSVMSDQPALQVSDARRRLITISAMLATLMQTLDMTIANVALPHMQGTLSATQDQINWVLTSYIVVSAVLMPLTGFLSARFGRKQVFIAAVVFFTITSVLCGIAQSLSEIVLYRALQGAAGAAIVPLSQTIMLDINRAENHGRAMAMWGAGVMLGPILGPTLGGWLTEYYNWRWVFFINLPIGVLVVAGLSASIPRTTFNRAVRFDALGYVFLAVAISCAQLVLDRGETVDWYASGEIWLETLVAMLAFYLFVVQLLTAKNPFFPPRLFQNRNFMVSLLLAFIAGVVLLSTMALLPPMLQHLGGYSVLDTGLLLAPRGAGVMLAMLLAGRVLIGRADPRHIIFSGFVLIEISLWGMTEFTRQPQVSELIWTGVVQGLGIGFVFAPLATLTSATLDPSLRTDSSSLFNLLRSLGSSFGVSIGAAELTRNISINTAQLGEHLNEASASALAEAAARSGSSIDMQTGMALLQADVMQEAALIAYLNDFRLVFLVTLLALPLVFLFKRPVTPVSPSASVALD